MKWVAVPCKAEVMHPQMDWGSIWMYAKTKGISNKSRSFLWRFLNNLLPSEQRLHHLRKSPSPTCKLCTKNEVDSVWKHSFIACTFSAPAIDWMMGALRKFDPIMSKERAVFLQIMGNFDDHVIPCVWIVAETLQYIWAKRRAKTPIRLSEMTSVISARCTILEMTQNYKSAGLKIRQGLQCAHFPPAGVLPDVSLA